MSKENPVLFLSVKHPDVPSSNPVNKLIERLIRERLETLTVTRSVKDPPTLDLVLNNHDLFWIEEANARLLEEGVIINVQFGYDLRGLQGLTFTKPFRFTVETADGGSETFKVRGASIMAAFLGSQIVPRTFDETTMANIARKVLDESGFDAEHRVVQDTVGDVSGVIQKAGETNLEFLRRLAQAINFKFYQTAKPDGTAVIHFHKQGFRRSGPADVAVGQVGPDPKYGESSRLNGNNSPLAGYIAYRYDEEYVRQHFAFTGRMFANYEIPIIADVLSWSPRSSTPGTPQKGRAVGIDLLTGEPVDVTVGQSDLDSASLSEKTLFVETNEDVNRFRLIEEMPVNTGSTDTKQATELAKAALESTQESVVKMSMSIIGDPRIEVGEIWKFVGFARYNGFYYLEEIRDIFSASGGYTCDLQWGTDGVDGKVEGYKKTGRGRSTAGGESIDVRIADEDVTQFQVIRSGEGEFK